MDLLRVAEADEHGRVGSVLECVAQRDPGERGHVVAVLGAQGGEPRVLAPLVRCGEQRVGAAVITPAEPDRNARVVCFDERALAEGLLDQDSSSVAAGEGEDVGLVGAVEGAEQIVTGGQDARPDVVEQVCPPPGGGAACGVLGGPFLGEAVGRADADGSDEALLA